MRWEWWERMRSTTNVLDKESSSDEQTTKFNSKLGLLIQEINNWIDTMQHKATADFRSLKQLWIDDETKIIRYISIRWKAMNKCAVVITFYHRKIRFIPDFISLLDSKLVSSRLLLLFQFAFFYVFFSSLLFPFFFYSLKLFDVKRRERYHSNFCHNLFEASACERKTWKKK